MKANTFLFLLSLCLMNSSFAVIYGTDDRQDLFEISDPQIIEQANSTLTFTLNGLISKRSDGDYDIKARSIGESLSLCPDQKFKDQPSAGACSATLISPKHVITAGHCMTSQARCEEIFLMAGFHVNKEGYNPSVIPAKDMYRCKKLLVRDQKYVGGKNVQDYALFELDREVTEIKPSVLGYKRKVQRHEKVRMIGYPDGIPSKVVSNIDVLRSKREMFYTNADAFKGNSGSGIFHEETGEVVGILFGGNNDYRFHHIKQCREVIVWEEREAQGDGETVTHISDIWQYLAPHLKEYY